MLPYSVRLDVFFSHLNAVNASWERSLKQSLQRSHGRVLVLFQNNKINKILQFIITNCHNHGESMNDFFFFFINSNDSDVMILTDMTSGFGCPSR